MRRPPVSVVFLTVSLSCWVLWSLENAQASIARTPEQEALWLLPRLKPVPDEEWAQVAGAKTSEKYEIVKGDTLYDISKRLFGDWRFWPKIWALNNQAITNPHLIRPGNTIAFLAGTGTSLPSIGIRTESLDSSGPTPAEQAQGSSQADGAQGQEWQKLVGRQSWEVQAPASSPEIDDQGFDRRSKVQSKSFSGFNLEAIASTEELEPLGEIKGGRTPGLYFSLGDTVFIAPESELQVGQVYALVHEHSELYSSQSGRSGFSYRILGRVKIIGVKDGTFIGLIEGGSSLIERGSKLVPLPARVKSQITIAGPSPVEGSIMIDKQLSTHTLAQHKFVFVDRGSDDGVREGMVFRAFQHQDPATGDTVAESDFIITADLTVVQVSERTCSAIITRSIHSVEAGDRVVLQTDVSDLSLKKGVREKEFEINHTGDKELEKVDDIDVSGGLGNKESKELRELERWKENGTPLESGGDGKILEGTAKTLALPPPPTANELDDLPANPTASLPAPASKEVLPESAPPAPGELDGPASDSGKHESVPTAPAPVPALVPAAAPEPALGPLPPDAGTPSPAIDPPNGVGGETQELDGLLNQ